MAQEGNINQKHGSGGKVALHSPSAIRLMKSRPPATGDAINPREFLKMEKHIRLRVFSAAAIVLVALATVLVVGSSMGIVSGPNLINPAGPGSPALTTHGFLELTPNADGWDAQTSTDPIVRVRADGSDEYLFCRAVPANVRDTIELDEGVYYLSWITPVDADGRLYIPPEGEERVSVRAGHTISRQATFIPVPPVESAFGDYAATIDIVYEAMEHGDETLSGEAGDAFMAKLQANANEAPNFFIWIPE